jgi:phenylacetate-CoA ligase
MSEMVNWERIYLTFPIWLQNFVISIEGRRLSKRRYDAIYDFLFQAANHNWRLDGKDMYKLQKVRLSSFLKIASWVPFWKDRFCKYAVDPQSKDPITEIQKLPILSKEEVKDNLARIVPGSYSEETILCHTSGTTGSGLFFPVTRIAEREQWAVWWRYRQSHGIDRSTWCGYFGGRSIVPLGQRTPPFWRINNPVRQIMFSAYHLCENTAGIYLQAIRKNGISWLHGYPSILSVLAAYAIDNKIEFGTQVRIVTTGAESLFPHQRQHIRKAFNAKVFQHYGQAEGVANFSECHCGRLHVDEDYSFVEFVPLEAMKQVYRVIGTNWTNSAFPLIRYDTGDLARLDSVSCPCGRLGRIVASVDGRKEDYLILPNGVRVGRLDHIFKNLIHVREAQIYQKEMRSVIFRVVKGSGYDEHKEEQRLFVEARKRLGNEIRITIEYRDQLPRSKSGKLRFVVSDIFDARISGNAESCES